MKQVLISALAILFVSALFPFEAIVAKYGHPVVDGEIEEEWEDAPSYFPQIVSGKTDIRAQFKIMWDERAIYILALIHDPVLDTTNPVPYQQDSVEIFIDENNDKTSFYQADDYHFRVNCENARTADVGDVSFFYPKVKRFEGGYLVEARVRFSKPPKEGTRVGFELQVNDADGSGRRVATINMFDKTGNAWQDPSLFGEVLLVDWNPEKRRKGPDRHDLLSLLEYAKSIDRTVFLNGQSLEEAIEKAEWILMESNFQEDIDAMEEELRKTLSDLRRSEKFEEPENLPCVEGLPDAFTFLDGSKVETPNDWKRRVEELKELYQFYMYGFWPDTSKEIVDYEIEGNVLTIRVKREERESSFKAFVSIPKSDEHTAPHPVIVVIGFIGSFDFRNWKFEDYTPKLNGKGYAVITFDPNQVAADSPERRGAFYTLYPWSTRVEEDKGVLLAWAWGASKILDVLHKGAIPEIDLRKTVVTGASRYGKAALVAGAFDERFAVVNPHVSGVGGAASFRYNFAGKEYEWGKAGPVEPLSNLQSATEWYWFNSVFREFKDPRQLPFDQHLLIALCAPRAVLISGGYSDWWTNPEGMWISFLEAKKVYDFLGCPEKIGFFMRDGGHGITEEDIVNLVDFCDFIFGRSEKERNFHTSRFRKE